MAVANVSGATRVGCEAFAGESDEVRQRSVQPRRGPADELGRVHPERGKDRLLEHLIERTTDALRDELPEDVEARVRVDPACPGRRERRLALERQPRGVGQQVPDGRTRRPGRLIEVEESLITAR